MRPAASFLLAVALLFLPGCALLAPLSAPSPRLAYVDTDGDLFTVRADGSDRRRLTRRGGAIDAFNRSVHFWPAWSPDGRQIAAARTDVEDGALVGAGLYAFGATGGERRLYAQDDTFPIYWSWAPDSRVLALLSTAPDGNGVVLRVSTPREAAARGSAAEDTAASGSGRRDPDPIRAAVAAALAAASARTLTPGAPEHQPEALAPRELLAAYPIYYAWSPQSTTLVAHVGGDGSRGGQAGLFEIPIDGGESGEFNLGLGLSQYRAPAISRDGRTIIAAGGGGRADVVVAMQDGVPLPRPLIELDGPAAFVLSPGGDRLAVSRFYPGTGRSEALDVIDLASGRVERWSASEMLAFYWSPDGRSIAWLAVDRAAAELVWHVGDGPEQSNRLTAFTPSDQLDATLGFFDQFAQSHAAWSADSRYLTFAGWLGRPDGTPERVWIAPADGKSAPRAIADGLFAAWSPTH